MNSKNLNNFQLKLIKSKFPSLKFHLQHYSSESEIECFDQNHNFICAISNISYPNEDIRSIEDIIADIQYFIDDNY